MRPSKLQNYMDIAEAVSKRSHDAETQVGAVLFKNDTNAIIATGFNGFVRSAPDARLPTTRPDKYAVILHAEDNLIINCARSGVSMDNCTLVCTLTPCTQCMRRLWQAGITSVISGRKYKDFEKILSMPDIGVIEESTPENFIKLTYVVSI